MVFSIHKTFTTNVKSKPPLVVFTVCLLGIIVTSICLAYYVHTHDKIVNMDAVNDWISLLKYMNNLEMCTEATDKLLNRNKLQRDSALISITTPAKLLDIASSKPVNIRGVITLEEWYSKCPEIVDPPSYVEVEFNIPKTNETVDEEVCVTITGPASFMPKLSEQQLCKAPTQGDSKTNWISLSTKAIDVNVANFCTVGSSFRLKYDINYNQNLKYDMFLSEEDRIMINSHLIVTSCFLVFIVILITCYALIRKTANVNNMSDSKQHLMSKGMYL